MRSTKPPYESIVTQKIVASELIPELQNRPEAWFFVAGDDEGPADDWSPTTSHAVSNMTHYLSDEGPTIRIEFHDGTPDRVVLPSDIFEVHSVAAAAGK